MHPHVSHVSYTDFMGVSNFEQNGLHALSPFALVFHPKRAAIAQNPNALPFSPKKSCPLRDGLINLNLCSQPSSPYIGMATIPKLLIKTNTYLNTLV